jgi:hypothetical protein
MVSEHPEPYLFCRTFPAALMSQFQHMPEISSPVISNSQS